MVRDAWSVYFLLSMDLRKANKFCCNNENISKKGFELEPTDLNGNFFVNAAILSLSSWFNTNISEKTSGMLGFEPVSAG